MCGRYTLALPAITVSNRFNVQIDPANYYEHYNAAPGQSLPVITHDQPSIVQNLKWGLVPFWAKDIRIGYKMINARSETILEKPAFRQTIKTSRCLVLGDSYFEWQKIGKEKIPFRIMLKDEQPFAMAGIWSRWLDAEERSLHTFSILTVAANDLTLPVHDRMPAILMPATEREWINMDVSPVEALKLVAPYETEGMKMYRVSDLVNKASNDFPELLEPIL